MRAAHLVDPTHRFAAGVTLDPRPSEAQPRNGGRRAPGVVLGRQVTLRHEKGLSFKYPASMDDYDDLLGGIKC